VDDLAECMGLSEPTISHHLSYPCEAGLVSLRTDGNQRFYHTNEDGLMHFKRLVADTEQSPELPQPAIRDD